MDDVPYGRILREGWIIILVATILGGAIAFGITRPMPRTYAATSTLLLQVESTQTSLFERNQFSQARIKSYPVLVDSPSVVSGVREDLDLDPAQYSDRDIRRMLSATNATDTVLMDVRADAPTAEMAAEVANSAAAHMSDLIEETENDESDERYVVSLVQALPAVPPLSAISPQVLPITGLGIVTGLAAGCLIALYRTTTNRRLITIGDIRRASGLPVVGQIPRAPRFWWGRTRAGELQSSSYTETVSNVMALAGPAQQSIVVVPAEPDAIGADALVGLVEAYRRAGRLAHVLDTRPNRFPAGRFRSLDELIRPDDADADAEEDARQDVDEKDLAPEDIAEDAVDAESDPDIEDDAARGDEDDGGAARDEEDAEARGTSADVAEASDADGLDECGDDRPDTVYAASDVAIDVLESALPGLVERFDDPRDVVVVVVDPGASALLATVRAPLVIGVRSRATTVADLLAITIRFQVMGIRPLGVLITGARSHARSSVSLSWNELDRLGGAEAPDPEPVPERG
ncbi:YveK family protein [Leucobacter sp.]